VTFFAFQILITKCTRLTKLDLRGLSVMTRDRVVLVHMLIENNPGITWFGAPIIVCFIYICQYYFSCGVFDVFMM